MTELTKATLRGSSNSNENIILTTKTNNIQDQENNQNQEKEIKQLLGIKTNSDFKNLREAKYKISDDLVQLILKTNLELREEEKKHLKSQSHNLIKQIIQQKKPEISLEIFSEALKIVQDPEIYNARSKIHKTLGQYKEALEDFKLAAINGHKYSNEDCKFIENIRQHQNLLNKEEMLSYLDQLISIIPNSSILYSTRGKIYKDQGEIEKANSDFEQALKINPNENWRNYEKAKISEESFHFEEALKFFQREREIQSSSDNKNQNLFAWKEATVRALSILIRLLRKDEASLMIEELKDYVDKNHDDELKERIRYFDISVSAIDKINYFKEINPRYIKVIEQINNLNLQREKEFDFFRRAEIDDKLIELADKIGDIKAAKEYEERANIDFAKITPDQKVTDKVNKIIYNEYEENKVLKARRWCKRTDFLLTESERDKLAKIDNIKQKVLTKKDLSNEDLKQLIDVIFSDNNVARLEQPIFELSQIDSKYSKVFKALLGQVDFKLGRDQSAKKILDELQNSLKENNNSTEEENFSINKAAKDILFDISYSKYKDKIKDEIKEGSTLAKQIIPYLPISSLLFLAMTCMINDICNPDKDSNTVKKSISESIKNNSTNLTEETIKKITDEIVRNQSQIISNIQKEADQNLYSEKYKEEIKNIIDSNLPVGQSNAVNIDYDKISNEIIAIQYNESRINIKNNNNSPNTSVKNNSSSRNIGNQGIQIV